MKTKHEKNNDGLTLWDVVQAQGAIPDPFLPAYFHVRPRAHIEIEDHDEPLFDATYWGSIPGEGIRLGIMLNHHVRALFDKAGGHPRSRAMLTAIQNSWCTTTFDDLYSMGSFGAFVEAMVHARPDPELFGHLFSLTACEFALRSKGTRASFEESRLDVALLGLQCVGTLRGYGWQRGVWYPDASRYRVRFGDDFSLLVNQNYPDPWTVECEGRSPLTVPCQTAVTMHGKVVVNAIPLFDQGDRLEGFYDPVSPTDGAGAFFLKAPFASVSGCVQALQALKEGRIQPREVVFDNPEEAGSETAGGLHMGDSHMANTLHDLLGELEAAGRCEID